MNSPLGELTVPVDNVVFARKDNEGIYATGHHAVIQITGTEDWYIVYHRFSYPNGIKMGRDAGYHREVCIDKLEFNEDGIIKRVVPIASKYPKEFMKDLKKVCRAVTKDVAEDEPLNLEEKWDNKCPVVIESGQRNWEQLSQYFQTLNLILKIIYTTNHYQIRKVTNTKGAFTNDMALMKWYTWLPRE